MARRKKNLSEEEQKSAKLAKLEKSYFAVVESGIIDETMTVTEKVQKLIEAAVKLQGEIFGKSDEIRIKDLEKVQEFANIDKGTYLDFVKICVLKNNDKLKEKTISKYENDLNKKSHIISLKQTFLNSYMNGKELQIADDEADEIKKSIEKRSCDEFEKIMQDSAKKREYITTILNRKYKTLAKAAEFVSNGELIQKDFKSLVDWQYFADGGYPTPKSPSKIWSIFNKFNYAYRTLEKWGYNKTSETLNEEFGLVISTTEPKPVVHKWQKNSDDDIYDEDVMDD